MTLPRFNLRNLAIFGIIASVLYGEYVIWFKSPIAQIAAICDDFRVLKEALAASRNDPSFHLIDEASAASLEPARLISKAVRACDGEAIDIEDARVR